MVDIKTTPRVIGFCSFWYLESRASFYNAITLLMPYAIKRGEARQWINMRMLDLVNEVSMTGRSFKISNQRELDIL